MIKKLTVTILTFVLIFCFAACGNSGDDQGQSAGLPNPMTELESLEALNEHFGCAMIAPSVMGVSDEKFFSIAGNPEIAEYDFTVNGYACSLRFAVAGLDTDISGYYRPDESGTTVFQDSDVESSYYGNDTDKLQRWFTIDGQYVLSIKDNGEMDYDTFSSILEEFQSVKPVNWNADVPFEDYKAIEGYYLDEESGSIFAAFNISGAAGHFMTSVRESETEVYEWDFPVTLDDQGILTFEKSLCTLYKSDESGVSTEEILPEGEGGTLEVKDGKIYCTNVPVESLKGIVFAPYSF